MLQLPSVPAIIRVFTVALGCVFLVIIGVRPTAAQCDDCYDYEESGQTYHYFSDQWRPLPNLYDGSHQIAQQGSCEQMHDPCLAFVTSVDLEQLARDFDSLKRAIDGDHSPVVFNEEEGSAQFLDCHGEVVESLPLTPEQIKILSGI